MKHCRDCGAETPGPRSQCNPCRARSVKALRDRQPERHILAGMVQRCHNPKHPKFHLYGGRGINVCDEWRGPGGFARFLVHIGPRPSPKHSVDRIDNSRGYEPGNVRWATQSEQMANTRRNRRVGGKTITELERETGITTLGYRLDHGYSAEKAVRTPPQPTERLITYYGVTRNCREWSRHLGGEDSLVATRLRIGWTETEAVSIPLGGRRAS